MSSEYEFVTVRDLYDEAYDDQGQPYAQLIKKDVKAKWVCRDLNQISEYSQVINERGNLRPGKTLLKVAGEHVMVQMKFDEVKKLLSPKQIKGLTRR